MSHNRDQEQPQLAAAPAPVDLMGDQSICYIREGDVEGKPGWLIVDHSGQTIGVAPSAAAAQLAAREHGLDVFFLN